VRRIVGPLLGYPFRLPLALLGVPPVLYASVDLTHALCTYFLHARFVPPLGPRGRYSGPDPMTRSSAQVE
jgi:hypothetical protein